ncbi:sigma-70 family RNA polymerase sigma factor [Sphingomonas aracearum]|uniref:RNA polymerase subunit sigma-70 n=1 Tax=Sphingomonas aracearum TaxID=2283317 RepID=A0A369VYA0_9SPHN|nr:sigma-70 family RNA polymerase sigma factor [Sphingomonas aracearum]RDE07376.1 RNA polymerase subunit sigma-70 [Sphingomonas aracearum]
MTDGALGDLGALLADLYGGETLRPLPPMWSRLLRTLDRLPDAERELASRLVALTPRLRSLARSLAGDAVAAEDLVQDTLLRAWRAQHLFDPATSLAAWCFTILRNVHRTSLRRRRWTGEWSERVESMLESGESQSASVELQQILALVENLPADQRTALQLVVFDHLSYEAAAEHVGVALGTLKSRVARARRALSLMVNTEAQNATPPSEPGQPARPVKAREPSPAEPTFAVSSARQRLREAKAAGTTFLIG